MLSRSHSIILLIDRNSVSLFQDTLPGILKFNFTPDLVANLDVIDREKLFNLILAFIQANKIASSSLVIILSDNVIYEKDLSAPAQKPDEIQRFLENVPFEEVLARVIKVGSVNRIAAVNKDLVMTTINAFVKKGSVVEAVVPGFIFGQNVNFAAGLNPDNARMVLGNAEILKMGNLLSDQERIIPSQNLRNQQESLSQEDVKKPKNLRQYILIGVFVVLLIILAVVYLNLGSSKTPPVSPKIKNSVNSVIVPTNPQQAGITTAPVDLKYVKIKIVQNSESGEKANSLKNGLLEIGFQDIVNEISEVTTPEKSSIIFSQGISADLKNQIIGAIKKNLPEISVLENQDPNLIVTILIGKLQ